MYLDIRETTTITKIHSTKELISSASNEQNSPPFKFFGDEENGLFQHQQLTTIKQQTTTTKSIINNEIKSKNSILFDKENKPFSTSTKTNLSNKKKLEEIEDLLNFNKAEENNTTTNDSVETSGCRFFCSNSILISCQY